MTSVRGSFPVFLLAVPVPLVDLHGCDAELSCEVIDLVAIPLFVFQIVGLQEVFLCLGESMLLVRSPRNLSSLKLVTASSKP